MKDSCILLCLLLISHSLKAEENILLKWKSASAKPVIELSEKRHSIHSYFNTSPESPDGKYVLYFSSKTEDAHKGDICIIDIKTSEETVLVKGVITEDAHRAACQQWAGNGDYVVYHDFIAGVWQVIAIDIKTRTKQTLNKNRQLGFGIPSSLEVPLYGCHWNPKENRHFEFVNIETKKVSKIIDVKEVIDSYGDWVDATFGTKNVSIFFPIISPDGKKVFFKIARGSGTDDFRSKKASFRRGKLVYDIENRKFINKFDLWGHPAWSPDSKMIIEKGNFVVDIYSGKTKKFSAAKKNKLNTPSDHPSMSPCGQFFVTDANISKRDFGSPGMWGIIIGESTSESDYVIPHRFINSHGAKSWRHSHPHPVFNAQGNRVYYNVSSDGFTRLYVLELSK